MRDHITSVSTGFLSNQGEKSINSYFIMVPLRKKVLKYGTPKPSQNPTHWPKTQGNKS